MTKALGKIWSVISTLIVAAIVILAILLAGVRLVGLTPYVHRRVSCNDEGLSLGQLVIAKKGGGVRVLGSTAEDRGIERP